MDDRRRKIVLSPHYDDFILSLGGFAMQWQADYCIVEDWIVFSRGNYVFGDTLGNADFSADRSDKISLQRYNEELLAAAELGIESVKKLGCQEIIFRGRNNYMAPSQKAYPLTVKDQEAAGIIRAAVAPLLDQPVDLFIPMAFQGHYDHILLRETVCHMLAKRNKKPTASIFFYEDLPYAAEASWRERLQMQLIMRRWKLRAIIAPIDLESKLNLLRHYPSQDDPSYASGITVRACFLQKKYHLDAPGERVFRACLNTHL